MYTRTNEAALAWMICSCLKFEKNLSSLSMSQTSAKNLNFHE